MYFEGEIEDDDDMNGLPPPPKPPRKRVCNVPRCDSEGFKKRVNGMLMQYFDFPTHMPLCRMWALSVELPGKHWSGAYKKSAICIKHFKVDQMTTPPKRSMKRNLLPSAVPTQHSHYAPKKPRKKQVLPEMIDLDKIKKEPPTVKEEPVPDWQCAYCPLKNSQSKLFCSSEECKQWRPDVVQTMPSDYEEMVEMAKMAIIPNVAPFVCPVCLTDVPIKQGVILKECLHYFCKGCLIQRIDQDRNPEVSCMFRFDDNSPCEAKLHQGEVRALISPHRFEQFLMRSVNMAESQSPSVHCFKPNCKGWIVYEREEGRVLGHFKCPICNSHCCLKCNAVHERWKCEEYQCSVDPAKKSAEALSQARLQDLLQKGEAMVCPRCKAIIQKSNGCDGIVCTNCKFEICWITKQARWGPMGKGDKTGGCHCNENGRRCHRLCENCH